MQAAAQADVVILVISARRGEFETGFEKGGQTREHAMLAKTVGVKRLIMVVNKMDDATVNWDEARYNECVSKIVPFLKGVGYKHKVGECVFVLFCFKDWVVATFDTCLTFLPFFLSRHGHHACIWLHGR